MTAAEELAALEATYSAWIQAGCPQSYTTPLGQTVTKASAEWMSKRIDALRRSADTTNPGGSFWVGQARPID